MPNINTIQRPVSLVGTGRSGTTLLTNVFRRHPSFESYGETANLFFPAYYYAEKSLPFCRPEINDENVAEYATSAIRSMLCSAFVDEKEYWFHKPILLPNIQANFSNHREFIEWYWKTYRNLFPNAFTLTVIRRPEEVIASYMRRWGQSIEVASANYKLTYELISHHLSCVNHVISFDDLVNDSENTIKNLFMQIGCEYDERCLNAFGTLHAPNQTDGKKDTLKDIQNRKGNRDTVSTCVVGDQITSLYKELSKKTSMSGHNLFRT